MGEHAHAPTGADEIADLGLSHARDAVKWSTDRAIFQIHLRGLHSRLGGGYTGQGGLRILIGSLVFLLADDLGLVELGLALESNLLKLRLGDGVGVVGLCLCQSGLEGSRVDRKKDVPLFDCRAFLVILSEEVSGDLGLDVGVLETIKQTDPLVGRHHILLNNRSHGDFHRSGFDRGGLFTRDGGKCSRNQ